MERYRAQAASGLPQTRRRTSGEIAKIRLRQTLNSDYLECRPEECETMRREILGILSRYLNLDEIQEIQLNFVQTLRQGVPYVKTVQIKGL